MPHASPLAATQQQALALRAAGNLAAARDLLTGAVESAQPPFGKDHPDVLSTAHLLARLHREADDPTAARRVLEEAFAAGERRWPHADPLMLALSFELGSVADELGNRHEARRNYTRVATAGPAVLGADHPAVRAAREYLGDAAPALQPTVPAARQPEPASRPDHGALVEPTVSLAVLSTGWKPHDAATATGPVIPSPPVVPLPPAAGQAADVGTAASPPHREWAQPTIQVQQIDPLLEEEAQRAGRVPQGQAPEAGSVPSTGRAPVSAPPTSAPPTGGPPVSPSPTTASPTPASAPLPELPSPTPVPPVSPSAAAGYAPAVSPTAGPYDPTASLPQPGSTSGPPGYATTSGPPGQGVVSGAYQHGSDRQVPPVPPPPPVGNAAAQPYPAPAWNQSAAPRPTVAPPYPGPLVLPPVQPERGRSRVAIVVALVAVLVALAAVIGVGLLLLDRRAAPPAPASGAPSPAESGQPPGDLVLRDDTTTITLSWSDPSDGLVPFMVAGGRAGQALGVLATVDPGQTSYTVNGLNSRVDYCFTVLAVYGTDQFATSSQVCTTRASDPPN